MGSIKVLMEQIRQMIKSYVDNALKNYPRIVSASVVSIKDKQAVVRMPYATDDSSDFKAYVVTSQLVSVGDVVNVAYWSSLSTAVILANTSTESASIGVAGDYNTLENKPTINGVSLIGDKISSDLKLYGDGNEPNYPVTSVNNKTGAVKLTADDVGALPSTTAIPTKTSDLTNDSGYITSDEAPVQSVAGKTGAVVLAKGDVGLGNVDNVRQYSASNPPPYPVTSVDGSTGAVTTNAVKTTTQTLTVAQQQQARTNIGAGTSSFDGNYNSLTNKPTIPSKTSQLENDSDFATETQVDAKYTKPASGIPKSDLEQSVQNSLNKADTALQEAPVTSVDGSVGVVVTNAVKTTTQTLTNAQKQQARENIGAGTSSFSGNYNDLTNKPSIPTKTSELTNDSNFATVTQVNAKYTKPAGGIPKADLESAVQTTLTNSNKEAYLEWGGKNIFYGFSPVDAGMVSRLGANRTAFIKANSVTVEYSRNGGTDWAIASCSNDQIETLFSLTSIANVFTIGDSQEKGIDKSEYMLRITVDAYLAQVYTELKKFVLLVATQGSLGSYCTIQTKTQGNFVSGNDIWTTIIEKASVGGWDGYNVLNFPSGIITYGGSGDSRVREIRFIFGVASHPETVNSTGLTVQNISAYGGVAWKAPSNYARYGTVYVTHPNQACVFPSIVSATEFRGSVNSSYLTNISPYTAAQVQSMWNSVT